MKEKLARQIHARWDQFDEWIDGHLSKVQMPFYSSVDVRDSGFKIAPVDSNLFPAGFNNICPADFAVAGPIFRRQILRRMEKLGHANPKKVLIVPENHTNNKFYAENLKTLQSIIESAGFETRIGWYEETPSLAHPIELEAASGDRLKAEPIDIRQGRASIGGFVPDLLVLNNDFSSGFPTRLSQVTQPVFPSYKLGWHTRRKSEHFIHYNRLAGEFAQLIGIDPWEIQVNTEFVDGVNFNEGVGLESVEGAAERVLARAEKEYKERGIDQKPFAFIKNNAGTYGMGIMVVSSVEELRAMNRRTKNKMSVGKGKTAIGSVVVQEGIPTEHRVDGGVAEPVIYLCGCDLVGGFLRANTERGAEENLNASGMVFKKLCMSDFGRIMDREMSLESGLQGRLLELVYGAVARVSALAAGYEIRSQD